MTENEENIMQHTYRIPIADLPPTYFVQRLLYEDKTEEAKQECIKLLSDPNILLNWKDKRYVGKLLTAHEKLKCRVKRKYLRSLI